MDMNFASKGVAGTALGLSIGALGVEALRGGLGGLFGGGTVSPDNAPVNRFEFGLEREIINKDAEIAYLKGRSESKDDALELYKYVDGRFRQVEAQIASQAANISCIQSSVAALQGLTKTVIPIGNVCPPPMEKYNSWTAPTTTTTTG